jgi:chorismate mutase
MKKIILCLVFLAFGSQQAVLAGGLPRPMKDLSSDLRNELERARLNADEYKNLYLDQQAEAEKLRTDLDSTNQKCNDCYRDKSQLDGAIANLRSENQELNRKVGEYKAKADLLAVAPPVVPAKIEAKPEVAKADETSIFHRVFGTLVGVPIGIAAGTPIGAVRGSISKAITYADGFSEYMGPGILGEAAGNISGLGAGAIAGAFSGAAKGFTTGVKYGYLYPFTARSVSLNGSFINGYNPYDFSDLKKSNT